MNRLNRPDNKVLSEAGDVKSEQPEVSSNQRIHATKNVKKELTGDNNSAGFKTPIPLRAVSVVPDEHEQGNCRDFIDNLLSFKRALEKSPRAFNYRGKRQKHVQDWLDKNTLSDDQYSRLSYEKRMIFRGQEQMINRVLAVALSRGQLADEGMDSADIDKVIKEYKHLAMVCDQLEYIAENAVLADYLKEQYPPNDYSYVFPGRSLMTLAAIMEQDCVCEVRKIPFSKPRNKNLTGRQKEVIGGKVIYEIKENKQSKRKILVVDYIETGTGLALFKEMVSAAGKKDKELADVSYCALAAKDNIPVHIKEKFDACLFLKNTSMTFDNYRMNKNSVSQTALIHSAGECMAPYGKMPADNYLEDDFQTEENDTYSLFSDVLGGGFESVIKDFSKTIEIKQL